MPYEGMRRVISSYDPLNPIDPIDPQEPPEYGLPYTGGGVINPPVPAPRDYGQRAVFRANRLRDFLAANPDRRGGPMGRRADGTVAYDPSMWGSDWTGPAIGPNNLAPRTVTPGGAPSPGAFNAANPANQPASPPPPITNRGTTPAGTVRPNWTPGGMALNPLPYPPRGNGGGGGI